MKKYLLILICLWAAVVQAKVTVQIDHQPIYLGETFSISLSQDNNTGGVPDLTPLQANFNVVGTERSVSYTVINGQANSLNQWIIMLMPKKAGIVEIPALTIGKEQTQPVRIEVLSNGAGGTDSKNNQPAGSQKELFLTVQVDDQEPMINQQVIYTVKLFNSRRLLDNDFQGPQVDNALLIPLGETRRYQTVENNILYAVEEQKYAIFPQKSGDLLVKAPVFNALIYDQVPRRVSTHTKPMTLKVKPVPASYQGEHWLPAKLVRLTERYENTAQTLEQGATLTRSLTIEAEGIPAQLLPKLQFANTDQYAVYPDQPRDHNRIIHQSLVGRRTIKLTYLFNQPGQVELPAIELHWFNLNSNKEEVIKLPPRSLLIKGMSNKPSPTAGPNAVANPAVPLSAAGSASTGNNWLWALVIGLALGWLATLLWTLGRRRMFSGNGQLRKQAWQTLQRACQSHDPLVVKDALLAWAQVQWPQDKIHHLQDLLAYNRDPAFKKQINQLNQILYGGVKVSDWRADELWRMIKAMQGRKGERAKANPLPPINPLS